MSKFTKGKWSTDDYGEYVFAHDGRMMVCQMRGWAFLTTGRAEGDCALSPDEAIDVQKANAQLIAAAPVMYNLLQHIAHKLRETNYDYKLLKEIDECLSCVDGERIQSENEE